MMRGAAALPLLFACCSAANLYAAPVRAAAADAPAAPGLCWQVPQAQTLEEAAIVAQNEARVAALPTPAGPAAMLALSDGRLKAAYGAGLLVGWGETGERPEFAVVTAVGTSALIAPFAFLGRQGDGAIADIFACDAGSLQEMARHAALYLNAAVLERIASRHDAGARLLVALPGSAARQETVWDVGAIAASRRPDAQRLIAAILLASVDLTTFIDPQSMPINVGFITARNPALRRAGAGEPFLSTPSLKSPRMPTYLIHNGVLFADEGEEYAAATQPPQSDPAPTDMWLLPAYDLFAAAARWHTPALIASPRANVNIQTQQSPFDLPYMRALFGYAYRQGRLHREWRPTVIDARSR